MVGDKVKKIIVLGAGSAGFMAAAALKTTLPDMELLLIRAPEIKIIGVGEGSTNVLTRFLHEFLKVDQEEFHKTANPTWKLGLRFLWGSRPVFYYSFSTYLAKRIRNMPRPVAYYCWDQPEYGDLSTMMMYENRAFPKNENGNPIFHTDFAYHVENELFVAFLEKFVRRLGVPIMDDEVLQANQDDHGITSLQLKSGRVESADLYVDCSGFVSVLLGKAMKEPFVSFADTLFCDRAVVGIWPRSDEPIRPYTTCETMSAGWCWQIEHENRIGRGYVYSSNFISDSDADAEFRRQNPKIENTRVVRFVSGYYRNAWVKNVVAIGNAGGFVEPLEATALGVISGFSKTLASILQSSDCEIRDVQRRQYNRFIDIAWSSIRDFLAVHYRFNNRLDNPFWNFCRNCTPLHGAEPIVESYMENGPTDVMANVLFGPLDGFGPDGYYSLLVGQQVPFQSYRNITDHERAYFRQCQDEVRASAHHGLTIEEILALQRSPRWTWARRPAELTEPPVKRFVSQTYFS